MKILARHLTVDLYNCKSSKLQDMEAIRDALGKAVEQQGYQNMDVMEQAADGQELFAMVSFQGGHAAVHAFAELRYVALDIFLCEENAEPEGIYRSLQKFFQPDKTKATLLKRGDFGKEREIKPKTKTSVAPLRKIHNTGAKVIRVLAHRNRQ